MSNDTHSTRVVVEAAERFVLGNEAAQWASRFWLSQAVVCAVDAAKCAAGVVPVWSLGRCLSRHVPKGHPVARPGVRVTVSAGIVYAVVDDALSRHFPLGDSLEGFVRREDAECFIEKVRGDDPEIAPKLRIEDLEVEAGARN